MDFFVLVYKTVDNFIEAREAYRPVHLALVKKYFSNGHLVMGGALEDPSNEALLVFKTENKELIEYFVEHDPYVKNGLIQEWSIRKWNVAIGGNVVKN